MPTAQERLVISAHQVLIQLQQTISQQLALISSDESPMADQRRAQLLGWRTQAEATIQGLINSDLNAHLAQLEGWIERLDHCVLLLDSNRNQCAGISRKLIDIKGSIDVLAHLWASLI